MNKLLWLKQNIDKRVVMISGVSVTAALVFWGCIALVKKLRKNKVLELWHKQTQKKNLSQEEKAVVERKIESLSSEELKMLIEMQEKNKDLDFKIQIQKIESEKIENKKQK
jgi:peroxiredoxin family protein